MLARLSRITIPSYAPYMALIAAVLLAYANVYRNAFVFDDIVLIVHNKFLQHWNTLPALLTGLTNSGDDLATGYYRPVQMLLYFLLVQSFGLLPAAFHTLNLALHACNVCLFYRLGTRLGLRSKVTFIAALLWGLHPLHTEAVTYISGTADLLYSFFCLVGLLTLFPDFAPRKFWRTSFFFILAIGSKESAIIFPALATITLFLVSEARTFPATYIRTWPLWLIAVLYFTLRLVLMHSGNFQMLSAEDTVAAQLYVHNLPNRIFTSLATLPAYFQLMVWPAGLHMERSFPFFTSLWNGHVLAGAVLVAGVFFQIFWGQAKRGLALSWGCLWFLISLSPDTGVLVPINALFLEHWLYLPTIGLALGFAQTISVWLDRQPEKATMMATALSMLAASVLGAKTFSQNKVWQNAGTFYENIFNCGEDSGRARNGLATFYWQQGEFEKSIEQFKLTIAHPAPLPQSMLPSVYTTFALVYLRVPYTEREMSADDQLQTIKNVLPFDAQIPEAVEQLNKALAIEPSFFWANAILSVIYNYQRDR